MERNMENKTETEFIKGIGTRQPLEMFTLVKGILDVLFYGRYQY